MRVPDKTTRKKKSTIKTEHTVSIIDGLSNALSAKDFALFFDMHDSKDIINSVVAHIIAQLTDANGLQSFTQQQIYDSLKDCLDCLLYKLTHVILDEITKSEKNIKKDQLEIIQHPDTTDKSNEKTLCLAIHLFKLYETVWNSVILQYVGKNNTKLKSKTHSKRLEIEKENTQTIEIPELNESLRQIAQYLLDCWLNIEDKELQLTCGKIFQYISDTFPSERVYFGTAYVLYLLLNILRSQGSSCHSYGIRLLKSRDILSLIDFEESDTDYLRCTLTQCFSCYEFVESDVGQRFLSFVLSSLHSQLTSEIIASVQLFLPSVKSGSNTLKGLSFILHNAWRLSELGIKLTLERCVEELVQSAVLCEPKIAARFRELLMGFYIKGDPSSSGFVCKSFPPLLYRYIPVACWKVRFNATALFSVVFPLVDVSLPTAEYEADLERQYATLIKLTEDTHAEVRRVAVQGVCRVLVSYWEMVPVEKTTLLLDALLTKAVKDKSSPQVRAAVLDGLVLVLNNPMSHFALKALLPKLSDCLHDVSPIVRRSMAALLQRVTEIKDFIPVTSIVTLDSLLSRLVKDKVLSDLELMTTKQRYLFMQTPPSPVLSNTRQTSILLSDLMFDSVLGTSDLPKQVERVLLMTEKYPLALLALVELTTKKLSALDRARLGVALFQLSIRKLEESIPLKETNISDSEDIQRRKRKYTMMSQVLLKTVTILLQSLTDSTMKNNHSKEFPRKKKSFNNGVLSEDNVLLKGLKDFIQHNLNETILLHWFQTINPIQIEIIQLLRDLPIQLYDCSWVITPLCQLIDTILLDPIQYAELFHASFGLLIKKCDASLLPEILSKYCTVPLKRTYDHLHILFSDMIKKEVDNKDETSVEDNLNHLRQCRRLNDKKKQKKNVLSTTMNKYDWTWNQNQDDEGQLSQCISFTQQAFNITEFAEKLINMEEVLPTEFLLNILQLILIIVIQSPSFIQSKYMSITQQQSSSFITSKSADIIKLLQSIPYLGEFSFRILVHRIIKKRVSKQETDCILSDWISQLYTQFPSGITSWWENGNHHPEESFQSCIQLSLLQFIRQLFGGLAMSAALRVGPLPGATDIATLILVVLKISTIAARKEIETSQVVVHEYFLSVADFVLLLGDSDCFSPIQFFEIVEALIFGIPSTISADTVTSVLNKSIFLKRLLRTAPHAVQSALERFDARLTLDMQTHPNDFTRQRVISVVLEKLSVSEDTQRIVHSGQKVVDEG